MLALDSNVEPPSDAVSSSQSFHGMKVVGRARVPSREAQARIVGIVDDGMRSGGTRSKCSNPRHGVHAVKSGHVVDLVICYECGEVDVHDGSSTRDFHTARASTAKWRSSASPLCLIEGRQHCQARTRIQLVGCTTKLKS